MIIEISETEAYEVFLRHVQFEVTGWCNMSCAHCRAWNEPRAILPLKTIRNILDFVSSETIDMFEVSLSGGEPFARRDLGVVVNLVASYPVRQIVITTNGSLSSKEVLADIADKSLLKPVVIQISVDSCEPADHDSFRGYEGAYHKAIATIGAARQLGLTVTIRSTIRKGKISSMEPLVQLASSLGVANISFGTVVPFGRAAENTMGMDSTEKRVFFEEMTRLKEKYQPSFEIISEDPLKFALGRDDVWNRGGIDPSDECSFGGCTAGITTFNVSSIGTITPCSVLPVTILQAADKTVEDIKEEYVHSPVIRSLLARSFVGKCGTCNLRRLCGGCRAIPYAFHGDILGSDETCWYQV